MTLEPIRRRPARRAQPVAAEPASDAHGCGHIRLRLHALPADNTEAIERLKLVFDILDDSGDRIPRSGGALRYRYLIVRPGIRVHLNR